MSAERVVLRQAIDELATCVAWIALGSMQHLGVDWANRIIEKCERVTELLDEATDADV